MRIQFAESAEASHAFAVVALLVEPRPAFLNLVWPMPPVAHIELATLPRSPFRIAFDYIRKSEYSYVR